MSVLSHIRQYYVRYLGLLNSAQPALLLAIRLYWGWQFFVTGRGKLMNIGRTAEFFASLNIPMPMLNAYMAGATECGGGLLLLAGVASRLSTVPLIGTMLVAFATAHRESVMNLVSNPDEFVTQAPFLFLLAAVIVLVFGPGKWSIDGLIERNASFAPCRHSCENPAAHSIAEA